MASPDADCRKVVHSECGCRPQDGLNLGKLIPTQGVILSTVRPKDGPYPPEGQPHGGAVKRAPHWCTTYTTVMGL